MIIMVIIQSRLSLTMIMVNSRDWSEIAHILHFKNNHIVDFIRKKYSASVKSQATTSFFETNNLAKFCLTPAVRPGFTRCGVSQIT